MYVLIFHQIEVNTKQKTDEIKLAHFSIKEYLLSNCVKEHHERQIKAFSLSQEHSHFMISQTCLAYLLEFKTSELLVNFPLMKYAAQNWIFHIQSSSGDESQESSLSELMMKLLRPDNAAFVNWVEIYDPQNASKYLPPLYYTCKAGLIKVTHSLLKSGVDVNTWMEGEYRCVLHMAVYEGHEAIAKLLIENGADVNAQGGKYGNALQISLLQGRKAITKLLIKNGADMNAQRGEYGNALQVALLRSHKATAKLMIENGADVNAQGGQYGNALQIASYKGQEEIAKLLIENGADVNAQGGLYGNSLQAASYEGYGAIAKLLIENGADVNAQGGHYGNAL